MKKCGVGLVMIAAVATTLVGCSPADGLEREPELRVVVGKRTLGKWIERAESGHIENAEEAMLAARSLLVAKGFDHYTIRRRALEATMALADDHDVVIPELVLWLDEDGYSRAASYLDELGPRINLAIPALVDALGSREDTTRGHAVWALRNAADVAAGPLEEALHDTNPRRRGAAAGLLCRYAGKQMIDETERARLAPTVIAILFDSLADDDPLVRRGAAPSFGSWGKYAASAVPDLIAAQADEDDVLTRTFLLQSVYSTGAVPASSAGQLTGIALDPHADGGVVWNAVICLQKIDGVAPLVQPAVVECLSRLVSDDASLTDTDPTVRQESVGALYVASDAGEDVVSALAALRDDSGTDDDLRQTVETTLRHLESKSFLRRLGDR
jgi:hypothetical protein